MHHPRSKSDVFAGGGARRCAQHDADGEAIQGDARAITSL
jgi:hypothetical protein